MTKLDNILNIQEKRGLVMFVFALLIGTILALSGVVVWLYIDNSKQRERKEERERKCLEEKSQLHLLYGQRIEALFERQRAMEVQIDRTLVKKRKK